MDSEHTLSKDPEELKPREKPILKSLMQVLSISHHCLFACLVIIFGYNILFWVYLTQRNGHILKSPKTSYLNSNTEKTRLDKLPKNLKYILLWSYRHRPPFYYFEIGQQSFLKHACGFTNCYVTDNKQFFSDITKFDAIAFNGNKALRRTHEDQLPRFRSSNQKYIYYNSESSKNQPLCQPYYDDYFNWTATFKLKSDLVFSYIQTLDNDKLVVAPKLQPDWIQFENMTKVYLNLTHIIEPKSRAAAWFVSNCESYSKREDYVQILQDELAVYNLTVDVYGKCGNYSCPREQNAFCMAKLKKEYFFYLAFENDFDEDYVTEKVVTALDHFTVPIVYGEASYERFIPPHSYIDATVLKAKELAYLMVELINSPDLYMEYFRWRSHYHYRLPLAETVVCTLCEALNDREKLAYSSYHDLRYWWNPNYESDCPPWLLKESTREHIKDEVDKVNSSRETELSNL